MKTIVIVDDDKDYLGLISARLEKWGYKVIAFTEGMKAIEYLTADMPPDLVLLDLELGDVSGFKVLVEARAKHPQLPVFIVTIFIEPEIRAQAISLKADYFLTKPFIPSELKTILDAYFERK